MPIKKADKIRKAAEQIADIIEEHLQELTPAEREARWRAFEKVVPGGGVRRARDGGRLQTGAAALGARRHATS